MTERDRARDRWGMIAMSSNGGARSLGASSPAAQTIGSSSATAHRRPARGRRPLSNSSRDPADESAGSGGPLIVPDFTCPGSCHAALSGSLRRRPVRARARRRTSFTFMKEKTFTNAAAPVAEGRREAGIDAHLRGGDGARPEDRALDSRDRGNARGLRADRSRIIDARLRLGLALTEEDQLLNGSGVAPNLLGLLVPCPGSTPAHRGGAAIPTPTRSSSRSRHCDDGFRLRRRDRDEPGELADGPAARRTPPANLPRRHGSVGGGAAADALGSARRRDAVDRREYRARRRVQTCGAIFRKGGVRVEASNSHASFLRRTLSRFAPKSGSRSWCTARVASAR